MALKLKMLNSTSSYNECKSFAGKLRTRKPSKWLKYTKSEIIEELKTIHDNSASMDVRQSDRSKIEAGAEIEGRGRQSRAWTQQKCGSYGVPQRRVLEVLGNRDMRSSNARQEVLFQTFAFRSAGRVSAVGQATTGCFLSWLSSPSNP